MARDAEQRKVNLINRAAPIVRRSAGKGKAKQAEAERLLRQYYQHVPPQDLAGRSAKNLAGAVMAMRKFAATRKPREAKIRVFQPTLERDGWESDHTYVEIINDDMPFLVDSVAAELSRLGVDVHLMIHPIVRVRRSTAGRLIEIVGPEAVGHGEISESFMGIEISYHYSDLRTDRIREHLANVLRDVRAAVDDWLPIRERVQGMINELKLRATDSGAGDVAEAHDFLQWIHDDNFTFLGFREYKFEGKGRRAKVIVDPKSGLGVLRDPDVRAFRELRHLSHLPIEVKSFVRRPDPLMVSKSDRKSTVHRPVHMDVIGVKSFGPDGRVTGERLIVGLFTSAAYNRNPREIPLLRRKLDKTIARAGFSPTSHDGKALLNILETFPRDELFQIGDDALFRIATGILHLQERQRVALFHRVEDFERFVSCLVYVPRDRYDTTLRHRMQAILERAFGGKMTVYNTQIGDSPLARLHFQITTRPGKLPHFDPDKIEAELAAAARSWADHLQDELTERYGEDHAQSVCSCYGKAFPSGYMEQFGAEAAVSDIAKVEEALGRDELAMDLYRPKGTGPTEVRFKVFHPNEPVPLSDMLPMLENMGLKVIDEIPHAVRPLHYDNRMVMIHDLGLIMRDGSRISLNTIRDKFQTAFFRVWCGDMESDGFNALIIKAGLDFRGVIVIRAYAKYLRQAAIPYSQAYLEQTLANNPKLARQLVALFEAQFDPARQKSRNSRVIRIRQDILDGLNGVDSADEDRIIRRFFNLVESTLRTNFYQPDAEGEPKSYISIKLDSSAIEDLPLPRPLREIFVYSPRFEAVHLRGGLVARGGLRWSDRPEDFRTEVLGLMKAQMVKNAVIVPVGSKGGFVVKHPPAEGGREAIQGEGIACYKMFISGLLDVTDNLAGGNVQVPKHVIRRDQDDPYLVVAADKGTATFSDIANGVAGDYGFWLGDAFASGGGHGYDHKKMGITARGAWESVKRHFREIGRDIQRESFTVVGVGDMSGDVFGNGMLLSKHTRLVAAFNHMHIFLDPDPHPAKSWSERNRLFKLPRSSWSDYDTKLISKGGGIYERRAKSITVSAQARDALGLTRTQFTPDELIRAILKADVDLLWFGGIGSYVKASGQSHSDVGDRANDSVRVNARDLKCKVIGEGANLGMTQLGRIEYGLEGGRLNTDAVDNSAGVDCSDHEVNIKILLDAAVADKKLTVNARNALLEKMTDEVGELVLRDNYLQSQAITLIEDDAELLLDEHSRLMRMLERAGRLDRAVESLPDNETLEERATRKQGLTRPEIAVVVAYAKIWMFSELLDSDLPDDPVMERDLIDYFPRPLRKTYVSQIRSHRLRREIICTEVSNDLINRVGGVFITELMERTGATPADIARAFLITREAFGLAKIWGAIEELDNKVPASIQITLLKEINRLVERATTWFLRYGTRPLDIGATIAEFSPGINALAQKITTILPTSVTSQIDFRAQRYENEGIPKDLARRVAYLIVLVSACDIVRAGADCKLPLEQMARLYFDVGDRFGLGWLRWGAEKLPAESHWQKLAADAVIEELYSHQRAITLRVAKATNGKDVENPLDSWIKNNNGVIEQTRQMLTELEASDGVDLSMLAVASRRLGAISTVPVG